MLFFVMPAFILWDSLMMMVLGMALFKLGVLLGLMGRLGAVGRMALQLWFSPWWLGRHRYGPLEYLWRRLTYGHRPD